MPASPEPDFESKVTCSCWLPPWNLVSSRRVGLESNSVFNTSCALLVNLAEERSSRASLWFRMYWSSGAGKAGDKGTAIDLAAKHASRVTCYGIVC